MKVRRFHVLPENIQHDTARLTEDEARHLRQVLRIRAGERVEVFDGAGGGWSGEVVFDGDGVFVQGLSELAAPPPEQTPPRLTLAMAMIKPARLEWALEKATELGVDEFLPLETAHSEFHIPPEKIPDRLARWERIVRESSKQCHRRDLLRVRPPRRFRDVCAAEEYSKLEKILFYEESDDLWRPASANPSSGAIIFIGPVGGWADEEVELAAQSGCRVHGLGSRILRSETAAVAAAAIFLFSLSRTV